MVPEGSRGTGCLSLALATAHPRVPIVIKCLGLHLPTYTMAVSPDFVPLWQPHSRTLVVPPAEIYLITDDDELVLTGELFCALAPYIDGVTDVAAITAQMVAEGSATVDEVTGAIGILLERGFVVEASDYTSPGDVYSSWWRSSPEAGRKDTSIAVVAVGDVPSNIVRDAITSHGLRTVVEIPEADLLVFVVDDYLNPDIAPLARAGRDRGSRILLVNPCGVRPTIGPWLGEPGPCWECLAVRLLFNRQVEKSLLAEGERMGGRPQPRPTLVLKSRSNSFAPSPAGST